MRQLQADRAGGGQEHLNMQNVAIVGTGLIGASFGLALREGRLRRRDPRRQLASARLPMRSLRRDRSRRSARRGRRRGGPGLPLADHRAHSRHHPPSRSAAQARRAGHRCGQHQVRDRRPGAAERSRAAQFLGGHPMAGKETRGAAAADADLFRGRTWVLTPDEPPSSRPRPRANSASGSSASARACVVLDADEHDRVVSLTSHLPQLASTALAATVAASASRRTCEVSGSGPGRHDAPGPEIVRPLARHPGHQQRPHRTGARPSTFRNWSTCARTCARGNCRKSSSAARPLAGSSAARWPNA